MKTETYKYTIRSPGGGGHSFLLQCLFHMHSNGQYKIDIDPELGHGHAYRHLMKDFSIPELRLPNGNLFKWHFTRDNFDDALINSKLVYVCFHKQDVFHVELKHFFKMVRFVSSESNSIYWIEYRRLHESGFIKTKVKSILDELTLDEKRILLNNVTKVSTQNHKYPDLPPSKIIHHIYFKDIFTNKEETIRNLKIITGKPITKKLVDAYDFYLSRQPKPWPDVLY